METYGLDGADPFNSRLRQRAVDDYNHAVERYEKAAEELRCSGIVRQHRGGDMIMKETRR